MTAVQVLKKYWGFDAFRPLQEEIVQSVCEGRDTLALLPTGGGKSICFQVPALMREGICIVISPLVALMKDQVENLKTAGIEAIAIYAGMGKREIDILLDNCIYGQVKFLYLSPERLLSDLVRVRISHMNVNLIVVDEAHCISQWGYDFRPPYLKIAELRDILPNVSIIALTATATSRVREDIIQRLKLKNERVFVKSFARSNLSYVVSRVDDKHKKLLRIVQNINACGLVYVRNRRETSETALFLQRNGVSADFYHAGLDKELRFKKQEDWKQNRTRVMVATNAFGMGIDKPDVRFVVHLDLPESLEAYYQEAGRAGRDEKKAYAVLLCNPVDVEMLKRKHEESSPQLADIKLVYHHLGNYFQLAYGAGQGLSLNFDIVDFCKRYQLGILKTLAALKYLERDGYLVLSENIYLPSRLMFTANSEEVYRCQIENRMYDAVIKTVQRSYGGAFDSYIKINEFELAGRLKVPAKELIATLHKLNQEGIISYIEQSDQPQLLFVTDRVDGDHLGIDAAYIRQRQQILLTQIEAVAQYASQTQCRSQQLLRYFDELNVAKCGVCDVCLEEKRRDAQNEYHEKIEFEILSALQHKHHSLDELVASIKTGAEADKIAHIRLLLDAGKIKTDGNKYYL
jgi:ATP-dependent DNA helicase RecQ